MQADMTRTKVILLFAGVVALAAGGIIYFLKVHEPKQRLAEAQEEIHAWDARWIAARDCLLGSSPGSAKVSEALAIRELSPDPWERKSCTPLISKLSRGEATDTQVASVEEAWRALDKAAGRVAVSFVSHVDPEGDAMRKKPDPLPVALDELEAAYAALRKAAELAPAPPPMDKQPLPTATLVPVQLGDKRVLSVQEPYVTSRAGLLAFGTVEGSEVQLQLVAGKPPAVTAVGAATQRAMPDGTWGARAMPDAIEVGQLDDKGQLATPAAKLDLPGPTQVIAAVGSWADGVVVFGAGNQLVVARCQTGTCKPELRGGKPYTVRSMAFATDAASGLTHVVWVDDKDKMWGLRLDPAQLATTAEDLDTEGYPKLMCLTADSAWVHYTIEGESRVMELKPGAHADVAEDDNHSLMGCSPGGAVMYRSYEPSYYRCAAGDCQPASPKAQRDKVPAAVVPNGIVGVEARGAVLAVRKGGPTDFYAVPNGFVPIVAMTDGSHLDVLGWHADGLAIARVAAR
jgi:hypothetical protein